MEAKKNPKADLTKKSGLFFSIGLLIALSSVITAFEWQQEESLVDLQVRSTNGFENLIDIPVTEHTAPIPKPVRNIVVKEAPDDPEIEDLLTFIDLNPDLDAPSIEIPVDAVDTEKTDDLPFDLVEESAAPKNGLSAFYKYVGEKIKYPAQARRMGIEGKVFVQFLINRDGSFSDVKVIKGIGAGCDEEATRIIESAPAWNPGKQRGKPVRQRYTLPITFKLS